MKIVNCMETDDRQIFEAFKLGFSDYSIKFDMEIEFFIERFFNLEGNQRAHSYVAFDEEKPIGVVLGGINHYDGLKTLRCGALAIAPDYRGKGVSQALMLEHETVAKTEECSQMMLEVLGDNHRGIHFYEKLGYLKTYILYYYALSRTTFLEKRESMSLIKQNQLKSYSTYSQPKIIKNDDLSEIKTYMNDIHINWQNDFHYIEKLGNTFIYGIYQGSEHNPRNLVSFVIINDQGKIYKVFTHPKHRGNSLGKSLLDHIFTEHRLEKLVYSTPGNSSIATFLHACGFKRESLYQYEMIKNL